LIKYAIAIGHYQPDDYPLAEAVEEWAGYGFDAVMLMTYQMTRLDESARADLKAALRRRSLTTTVHASFEMTVDELKFILDLLGESLYSVTFDAAWTVEPRGRFYDFEKMRPMLEELMRLTDGTDVVFGLEDFPLDDTAVDFYRGELTDLLRCPRYGLLIDLGHMNVRRHLYGYFRGMSVEKYFANIPRRIVEIHIHDNKGDADSHAHIGYGNIDYEDAARGLHAVGFDGVSTIEIAPSALKVSMDESKPQAIASMKTWRGIWEKIARESDQVGGRRKR